MILKSKQEEIPVFFVLISTNSKIKGFDIPSV